MDLNKLPVEPAITPALGLAGAIMMLTGVIYTLIGIRTKWLHIFLSSAYLVSLAITVLIIYVMHPPISNAIQGAYFVAAFVTGVVFGIGSVVFNDITECLGCLLGGFSLSMWFMVLRPGGLVRTTVGRVILIACFSLGVCALYFHRFTRPYGLIGSISFTGATVIVIGIDCFSRAGLKEFWMYIWSKPFSLTNVPLADGCTDLNVNVFPPQYSGPYPVTRGIRVEIAAIVLLSLVGVMSQLKVWKIVRKRKEQKEAHRLAEERRQEQAELDLGRRLEEGNVREKMRWEATYGGRTQVSSGLGNNATSTPCNPSTSAHEDGDFGKGSMESTNKNGAKSDDTWLREPAGITVRVASEDSIYEMPSSTTEDLLATNRQKQPGSDTGTVQDISNMTSRSQTYAKLVGTSTEQCGPKVTPLPFNVVAPSLHEDDSRSSIATFAASDRIPSRMSERLSGSGLLWNLSRRPSPKSSASVYNENTASSVAATADDIGDDASSRGDVSELGADMVSGGEDKVDVTERLLSDDDLLPLTSENLEANKATPKHANEAPSILPEGFERLNSNGGVVDTDRGRGYLEHSLKPTSPPPALPERSPSRVQTVASQNSHEDLSPGRASALVSQPSEEQSSPSTLRNQLPEGASKVVMVYRTNEWAKHLEKAEAPEMDDLRKPLQDRNQEPIIAETAAPVHVKALQQTPLTAEPAPMKIKKNLAIQKPELNQSTSSRDSLPSQQRKSDNRSSLRRSSMGKILDRSSPQVSLPRRNHRSSSSPLAESPIDENVEMTFPKRISAHPTNALMAHRSSQLQLARTNSSNSPDPIHSQNLQNREPDSIPSAHRQSLPHRNPYRNSSRPSLTPGTSATLISPTPPQNRETIAANWRSSLRQDPRASNQALNNELEGRQTGLLMQQRSSSAGMQAADVEKARRETQAAQGMRSGDLLEAHQRAMRRMQGSVKH